MRRTGTVTEAADKIKAYRICGMLFCLEMLAGNVHKTEKSTRFFYLNAYNVSVLQGRRGVDGDFSENIPEGNRNVFGRSDFKDKLSGAVRHGMCFANTFPFWRGLCCGRILS